ncbi:MAG: VOC family protein [Saprospiraceae bacterium]|nr:VOC family protein [Saprospiraceae bacterium]
MKKNPINWFEIPVKNLERAASFYEKILGCKLSIQDFGGLKMAWFPMVQDGPGATGSLVQQESYIPSYEGSMVYFSVEDINKTLAQVEEHGGKVLNPKNSIGEFGFVAHFEDTEGNRVALHSDQ